MVVGLAKAIAFEGGMAEERYLTVKEAARELRRHPKTVWRWAVDGKIAFHQQEGKCKILIPRSAIEAAIKNAPERK